MLLPSGRTSGLVIALDASTSQGDFVTAILAQWEQMFKRVSAPGGQ
jgi:hypothetical protein